MRIVITIEVDAIKPDAIEMAEGLHESVKAIMGMIPAESVVSTDVQDSTNENPAFYPTGTDW